MTVANHDSMQSIHVETGLIRARVMETRAKILVVDDAPNIRRSFSRILEQSGFTAIEASSGEEAIERMETESVALTLMDVVMPGMGGFEASRRIRAMRTDHPVVLMSGYAEDYIKGHGLPEGVVSFLRKPIDEKELIEHIQMALQNSGKGHSAA